MLLFLACAENEGELLNGVSVVLAKTPRRACWCLADRGVLTLASAVGRASGCGAAEEEKLPFFGMPRDGKGIGLPAEFSSTRDPLRRGGVPESVGPASGLPAGSELFLFLDVIDMFRRSCTQRPRMTPLTTSTQLRDPMEQLQGCILSFQDTRRSGCHTTLELHVQ